MGFSGLMISESDIRYGNPRSFRGRGDYNLLSNSFGNSNEEIMGRKQKAEVLG